jgi:hypothetical protein
MYRLSRLALVASTLAVLSASAAIAATAAPRMLMGFQDDPSLRWAKDAPLVLDRAAATGASVIRATAEWRTLAPTRPAKATDSFDPAYKLDDLDAQIRNAAQRGMESLITIWGTPGWANGGKGPNVAPRNVADLTAFARALADRYSGRHAGYPYVGRWSVWNEPNLELFLKPQFDARGRIVGPAIYAKLYRASYAGIKAGNSSAQVAIGETSARGRDKLLPGVSGSLSPGKFAELVAKADPRLKFDAWAHHPYPTVPNMKPLQRVRWPSVTLPLLPKFETSLDKWFHRKGIAIWITEYGHETKPGEPRGVTLSQQSAYLKTAVNFVRRDPRVQMFIWFIIRDDPTSHWQSGFFTEDGTPKPALATWTSLVALTNGITVKVKPNVPNPVVRAPVPRIGYYSTPGTIVGMTYRVYDGSKLIAVAQPAVPLRTDGAISFPVSFTPKAGKTYTLTIDAKDAHGNAQLVTCALVAAR